MSKPEQVKCPNCGANLDVVDSASYFFCRYCGTKIEPNIAHREIVHRSIDETEIEKARLKHEAEMAKLKREEERERVKEERKLREEEDTRKFMKFYRPFEILILIAAMIWFFTNAFR